MCNWQQIYPCRLPDQEYWSDCNECGMFYILYMKVMMHGSFPGFQSQPFSIWLGQKAERTNIIIFEMCINYFESLKTIKSFPNKGCYIISICFYFNDKTVWFGTWTVWRVKLHKCTVLSIYAIYIVSWWYFVTFNFPNSCMLGFQGRILSFWYAKTDTVESLQRYMHRTKKYVGPNGPLLIISLNASFSGIKTYVLCHILQSNM